MAQGTLLGSWAGSSHKIDAAGLAVRPDATAKGRYQKGSKGSGSRQTRKSTPKSSNLSHALPHGNHPQSSGGLAAERHCSEGLRDADGRQSGCPGSLYDLFCVICHRGSLAGGHYTAFLRCGPQWFLCDDACLMAVAVADVVACQPYMLFYSRSNQYS